MRVLVTGANGYLGLGIVKKLLDDGIEVIATDICTEGVDERAEKKLANIFEIEKPYEFFGEPDVLLHLAWRDGFKHNSDVHMIDLPKHFEFVKKMVTSGIKKVCVMGSMHEIGFYEGAINENTPTNPLSLYGISKNALRNAVQLLVEEYGITYQWIRGFYIVGNTENGCSVFSKIVQAENEGKEMFPFTSGQNKYDFLSYEKFCEQVASVVEQDKVLGIINCCSGEPQKLADRVEMFIKENRYKIKLGYGQFPDRPYDSKAVWGDDGKIREIMERKHTF